MLVSDEFRSALAVLFTIAAYATNILSVVSWLNGHHFVSIGIWVCYGLEKWLSSYSAAHDDRISYLMDGLDLYMLYARFHEYNTNCNQSGMNYMLRVSFRFWLGSWLINLNLFSSSSFSKFSISMQFLVFFCYSIQIIQSAICMYMLNSCNGIEKEFVFIRQLVCVLLQVTTLYGTLTLFLMSCDPFEAWMLILIKLILTVTVYLFINKFNLDLYVAETNTLKLVLTFFLMAFSFASETGPFLNYGLTSKPDCNKDKKISTQKILVFIRAVQSLESAFYVFVAANSLDVIYQKTVFAELFLKIVITLFSVNSILSLTHIYQTCHESFTKNYTYFAIQTINQPDAYAIVKQSKNFIFIEFEQIQTIQQQIQQPPNPAAELQVFNILEGENETELTQEMKELLWSKVFLPIPKIGFRKLIIPGVFNLNNESVQFTHTQFFYLYINSILQSAENLPHRRFFFGISDPPLSQSQLRTLHQCLLKVMFQLGYSETINMLFAQESLKIADLILNFKQMILSFLVFSQVFAPHQLANPAMIFYDLYDN